MSAVRPFSWLCVLACVSVFAPIARADALHDAAAEWFVDADEVTGISGTPPAATVVDAGQIAGYLFYTDEAAPIPGYSGKPIRMLVGIDAEGRLLGARIVNHEEPILVLGIDTADLDRFLAQYRGMHAGDDVRVGASPEPGKPSVDGISGASITVMVLNRSITLAAQRVAQARGLLAPGTAAAPHDASGEPAIDPTWLYVWKSKRVAVGILVFALGGLLVVLFWQDWLARQPTLLTYVREAFLVFTVVFIGGYGLAQLSIVNVLTFLHALAAGFRWDTFLIEPLMFILWGFVAMTIVLWGRGVYCGWLCPFGALQELLFQLAKKVRIPSYEPSEEVHERLWAIKYVIAIALFGVSLGSLEHAVRLAEVEPFKTAVTLRFDRPWPYISWAVGLLAVGCVTRKFYCRYLCPLGAALTFPGRFAIFDWLRRRRECGKPCQTCATECEVRAITPTGEINKNECQMCLDCQVTYWNAHKCPPLAEHRKKRERRESLNRPAPAPADAAHIENPATRRD
jgi:polyferredoxin